MIIKKNHVGLDVSCKRLLWIAAFAVAVVLAGMIYLLQIQKHISGTHAMVITAAEHIIGEATASHLLLEEILLKGQGKKEDVVFEHLAHVRSGLEKLQYTGEHTHLLLPLLSISTLRMEKGAIKSAGN